MSESSSNINEGWSPFSNTPYSQQHITRDQPSELPDIRPFRPTVGPLSATVSDSAVPSSNTGMYK